MTSPLGPLGPPLLAGGAGAHAFFLDVDGTLLEMAPTPDQVRVDGEVLLIVDALGAAAGGALALVSGRSLADVDRLFAPRRLPAAGQHGAERRDSLGGGHSYGGGPAQLAALRTCVGAWAAAVEGLLVEDKGLTLAVHYRQAPHLECEVHRRFEECLGRVGGAFRLQPGRLVLEARPANWDKGVAVREFMSEEPFAGRIPVFVGDDATDEDGFAAARQLGGHAVKVGRGASLAPWRLEDVQAVRSWLAAIAAAS
ncbi:MAG TPA: trehalose-phosphatase [Rhodocyclaceae bacterium]|nr:trehalose-phosphatase [Rhodocyclaceae bacterium]